MALTLHKSNSSTTALMTVAKLPRADGSDDDKSDLHGESETDPMTIITTPATTDDAAAAIATESNTDMEAPAPKKHKWKPSLSDKASGFPAQLLSAIQIIIGVVTLSLLLAGLAMVAFVSSRRCLIGGMLFYLVGLPAYEAAVLAISFAITGSGIVCKVITDETACNIIDAYIKWGAVGSAAFSVLVWIAVLLHYLRTHANKRAFYRANKDLVPESADENLASIAKLFKGEKKTQEKPLNKPPATVATAAGSAAAAGLGLDPEARRPDRMEDTRFVEAPVASNSDTKDTETSDGEDDLTAAERMLLKPMLPVSLRVERGGEPASLDATLADSDDDADVGSGAKETGHAWCPETSEA